MDSRSRDGSDVAKRSRRYLTMLSRSEGSVQFEMALYQLRTQYDLLDVEFIEEPAVLELQRELHRLAETNDDARAILTDRIFGVPPVVRLTEAIICQAKSDQADRVKVDLGDGSKQFSIEYRIEGIWREAIAIPANLSNPLRTSFIRLEGLGYPVVRQYWPCQHLHPCSITLNWISKHELAIEIQ